jgi:hypothetical protein
MYARPAGRVFFKYAPGPAKKPYIYKGKFRMQGILESVSHRKKPGSRRSLIFTSKLTGLYLW